MKPLTLSRCLSLAGCGLGVVLLTVALPGEAAAQAKTPAPTPTPMTVPPTPAPGALPDMGNRPTPPPFQFGPYGAHPHLGQGGEGAQGYLHYDHPNYRYGHYYRPAQFGRGAAERCAPSPFRPRGYGNLFNEPTTCFRIDYNRFVLRDYKTEYGPSYYRRLPDPRCADHDCTAKYRPGCDACGERKTKVWTLSGHKHKRH